MRARAEYRERDPVDVAVLDALVDRSEEGLTVFELRTRVDETVGERHVDIDAIEAALSRLEEDSLITAENENGRTRIHPDDRVVPDSPDATDRHPSVLERIRDQLPF